MRRAHVFLSVTLVVAWLGSSAGLAAPPQAAGDSVEQAAGPGQTSTGLTPSEWQRIQAQVAKLTAADGAALDFLGLCVSVSGDTAVVGAFGADVDGDAGQGAAYVFYRNQGGPNGWGQVAKLTAADGAVDDQFGYQVSVDSNTAVVGAFGADVDGNADLGAAYVFYRDQGGPDAWGQVAKLTSSDGAAGDAFGFSLSVSGDTAVIGAGYADVGGSVDQGAAYVFYRDLGGPDAWGQVAKLSASDGAPGDAFGSGNDVSLSGNTALVGAEFADVGYHYNQGAAYVFYRDWGGPDSWGQVAKLTTADGAAGDFFGDAVSVSGDTAVVGASWATVGGISQQGAAYVFYRDQGGPDAWGQVTKLTADDGGYDDELGALVCVNGDTAVVGAIHAAVGMSYQQGAAYVYSRNQDGPDAWGQVDKLTSDDGAAGDHFGFVSVSGSTVVVGAPLATVGGNSYQGAAYVFALGNAPPVATDDAYSADEDTPLSDVAPGVLLNDTDPDGDPLTVVLDTGPAHGTLDLLTDGSFTYTPTLDFAGVDAFTYHANDGAADSNVATVAITVTSVNDAPVAASDLYTTPLNVPLVVAEPGLLLNDSDAEDDPLTAVLDTGPAHGTLELDADGSFTYTPAPHFVGVDTFTYHANDGAADSNVATVQITVTGHVIYLPLVLRDG